MSSISVYEEDEAAKVKARVQQDIQDGNVPIPHAARDEDSEVKK
jgi:hypothetical protein